MGSGEGSIPLKIRLFVYLSHALSTWGDRMWSFGVGLFMVIISPESLRVTAVYGLSMGTAVLLFGALVGEWIDRTPRLKAARMSLIVQNTSVVVCALIVYTVITWKTEIQAAWPNEGLLILSYVAIILVAILAMLGSIGTNIAVQKDWIVEICGDDKNLLASMTATLRRIDLCNKLVAPIATGQIMYFASVGVGAFFIAGWNLVSVFIEYILLWKVYSLVPALKNKKLWNGEPAEQEMETLKSNQGDDLDVEGHDPITSSNSIGDAEKLNEDASVATDEETKLKNETEQKKEKKKDPFWIKMFSGFIILYRGWKTYIKYDEAFAGLGLAALYMTVLGFDNITVGFAYTQGINESIMGVAMAAGAITGIVGTFLYPFIGKRIGLERTGLFGFFFEVMFLCLCVASIWAPGSPFDPFLKQSADTITVCNLPSDNGTGLTNGNLTSVPYNVTNSDVFNKTIGNTSLSVAGLQQTMTGLNTTGDQSSCAEQEADRGKHSLISVWLLLAGIIGARCGLWMADLTITQLFLEHVKETERGIVNGVQTSLNKLMDMLKFIMVIAAPDPHVFGILILVSFFFIILGWISYAKYSYGVRGHLFHFDKIRKCECSDTRNNNQVEEVIGD
ncbi:solute carrier family 40 member 1-like [Ruditapes philippinarum]|uniref:solute carrier family 40 member 1-like n=1 Tax=Ruditapes philippinarum TaxID=129788 RepID=UPI00295BA063|nr:solute carrier family 40 member 1-like [Ruditapes philippinarum]